VPFGHDGAATASLLLSVALTVNAVDALPPQPTLTVSTHFTNAMPSTADFALALQRLNPTAIY